MIDVSGHIYPISHSWHVMLPSWLHVPRGQGTGDTTEENRRSTNTWYSSFNISDTSEQYNLHCLIINYSDSIVVVNKKFTFHFVLQLFYGATISMNTLTEWNQSILLYYIRNANGTRAGWSVSDVIQEFLGSQELNVNIF